ncbi:RES family NAD+ phosphorylase [Streptomyces sp. NPDC059165]|uniref:RES family NAD+ phosphorylase n=1 Tax=Streptomyces sp. NPDC059165 TaxID=3346751 RepID=UPI0036922C94
MTSRVPRGKKRLDELGERFPDRGPVSHLYRSHQHDLGAIYYCGCGYCRFDPPKTMRDRYGTCCTAEEPEVAVLEHLAGAKMITPKWVAEHRISEVTLRANHKIADLLASVTAGDWGVGGDLQAGMNRPQSQNWGAAFYKAGFEGVRHKSRRDPSLQSICFAFYGRPGAHEDLLASGLPQELSRDLLHALEKRFGVRKFPPKPLPS